MSDGTRESHEAVERSCENCGYDLSGLGRTGRCPECGTVFGPGSERTDGDPLSTTGHRAVLSNISDAPAGYLMRVSLAAGLAFLSVCGIVLLVLFRADDSLVYVAVQLCWSGSIAVLMLRRHVPASSRINTRKELRGARLAATVTQALWPVAGTFQTVALTAAGTLGDVLVITSAVLSIFGTIGLVPMCWWLGHLAHWAANERAAAQFTGSAWTFAVLYPVLLVSGLVSPHLSGLGKALEIVVIVSGLAVLVASVAMLIALFQLSTDANQARGVRKAIRERDERRLAREEARAAEFAAPPSDAEVGGDPSFAADLAESGSHRSGTGQADASMHEQLKKRLRAGAYIEPTGGDDDAIELAPLDEDPPANR
ncbi:MAG: hypothetical protein AAGG07_02935 [Planctomycetota bacterium]